jgi:murein DD-endopeptidase MepM/ murein hydrolase activator NlpD
VPRALNPLPQTPGDTSTVPFETAAPRPTADHRSTRLVRALVLSALGIGLLGLSQTGAANADHAKVVHVVSAASVITLPEARASEVPPLRTSRSAAGRTAPTVRKAVTPKKLITSSRWYRPSAAGVVSGYGHRWGRMHKGIDFGAHYGDNIRAIGDGVVIGAGYLGDESGYGKITLIRHKGGIISAYAHQSKVLVHPGERVHGGEVIGLVGSTGHVTGPHLHFEIRHSVHGGQVNPLTWLRQHHVYV